MGTTTFPYMYRYSGSHAEWLGAGVSHLRPCGRIPGVGQCPCGHWEAVLTLPDGRTMTARHMRRESIAAATPAATVTVTATGTGKAPECCGRPMVPRTAFVTGYRFHVCGSCHRNTYSTVATAAGGAYR